MNELIASKNVVAFGVPFSDDVLKKRTGHVHPVAAAGKRVFDIVAALLGLGLASPLFPFIALAIRLDSAGPVLFRQLRIGRACPDRVELFMMIKFRSMCVDAESNGKPVWAEKQDRRITRIGLFLRKTRLDELPQLWNVLRGEMSLIGPRPERPGLCDKLEMELPYFAERTYGVLPGVTGLAQVCQGYDASIDDVRSKLSYDHAYALSLSQPLEWLRMDISIMFRTLRVMVGGQGQ